MEKWMKEMKNMENMAWYMEKGIGVMRRVRKCILEYESWMLEMVWCG